MKRMMKMIAVALAFVLLAGCMGSFGLTKSIYNWNTTVGDPYVNHAVFWVFGATQVYTLSLLIDTFGLNLIEYWTGANPVQGTAALDREIITPDGQRIMLHAETNSMTITDEAGTVTQLSYNGETGNWLLDANGESTVIANQDGDLLTLYYPDGTQAQQRITQ